jgi:hypothetical protein
VIAASILSISTMSSPNPTINRPSFTDTPPENRCDQNLLGTTIIL